MKKTFRSIMAIAIAAMTFTACEDVPAPYDVFADEQSNETPSVVAEGSGTQADPFNVAAVLEYVNTLGTAESADQVYVKGIVASITEIAQGNFGNATYTISDDGTSNNIFTVYRSKNLGNTNFTSADELAVGDEVVVVGKVVNYNGKTPEFVQNASYLYSRNGKTSAGGSETVDAKKATIAEFNAAAESDNVWYELTGTVKNLKDGDIYGNFDLEDATGSVYVYGLLSEKGGEKKLFQELAAAKGIKNGSKITIIGTRGSYNGKIEVMNAYFVSIEGGDTPQPSGEVKKVTVAEFNAAAESTDVWYQLTGTVKNLKDGDLYGNFDLEDATGSVYVYGLLSEKGGAKKLFQELAAAKGIKEGSVITIIGNRGSYNDKIEVTNAYFVSIEGDNGGNTGGNDNPNPGGGDVVTSLTNGDFETWADGIPTGWKSASTASSATLAQSTDAHGGNYSVNINGKESSNVRLACQEITLAAGTYVFTFYAKATTADAAQVRPGYVPVTDGKVGSYAYGDYATINNTGWTQVSNEFTLDAETTLCLVVMNPKKSNYSSAKDVLVDDATLTKK